MKKLIGGGALIFIGLFMLFGLFARTTPATVLENIFYLVVFTLSPLGVGSLLIRSHFLSKKKSAEESRKVILVSREKEVLRLAKEKGGELTIPDVVTETSMNAEEADEIMREMVVKRYADMKVTDQGNVIYEFFDLLREKPESNRMVRLESWTDDRDVN